jgi:type IV pilus assembly protein PilO
MTFEDINNLQPEDIKKIGGAPLPVRIGAVVVIAVIVVIAVYSLMIKPNLESLERIERQELELRSDFEKKQRKASNLEAYELQLAEMERTFGTMLKSLPDRAEVESLLIEISRAGSFNNLKINLFEPTGEISKEFYAEYPIKMELEGNYAQFSGFIDNIASLQRIVTLENIEIKEASSKDQDDNEGKQLIISLVAKTYRYLSDEEAS